MHMINGEEVLLATDSGSCLFYDLGLVPQSELLLQGRCLSTSTNSPSRGTISSGVDAALVLETHSHGTQDDAAFSACGDGLSIPHALCPGPHCHPHIHGGA